MLRLALLYVGGTNISVYRDRAIQSITGVIAPSSNVYKRPASYRAVQDMSSSATTTNRHTLAKNYAKLVFTLSLLLRFEVVDTGSERCVAR